MQIDMHRIEYTWEAREVVREIDDRPHLLLRVDVKGGTFPQRALEPVARITSPKGEQFVSWFATISPDERTLSAYFPVDVPDEGILEFGYFPVVVGRTGRTFTKKSAARLDRERLSPDIRPVTQAYLVERGIVPRPSRDK